MSFWKNWSDGKKWLMGILSALIIAGLVSLFTPLISGLFFNNPLPKPEQEKTGQEIKSEIQNIIGYRNIADMVCIATPEGGDGLDKWEIFKSRITRNIEAIEKIINYPNFRDNVDSSIHKFADVSLQEIKGILNIHHDSNTLELVNSLKRIDRLYQTITEVLLYFVGEHSISNDGKFFPRRLHSIRIITKNEYYCGETLYQKPTKQSLSIR